MKFIAGFLLLIFSYILQTTVIDYIKLWSIKPDLLLTVIICYSIVEGKERATMFALFAGLLMDFLWGRSFGIYTLIYILIALFCAVTAENIFNKNAALALISVFIFSILFGVLFSLVSFNLSGKGSLVYLSWRVVLPTAIFNSLFAVPVFAIVKNLNKRFSVESF